jgi:hypothetical protein
MGIVKRARGFSSFVFLSLKAVFVFFGFGCVSSSCGQLGLALRQPAIRTRGFRCQLTIQSQ